MKDMCMAVRLLVLSRALVVVGSLLGDLLLYELFMNTNELKVGHNDDGIGLAN